MAKVVGAYPTAEEAIQKPGLHESAEDFLGDLTVEQAGATQFIERSRTNTRIPSKLSGS
jgi:hypothetical protein